MKKVKKAIAVVYFQVGVNVVGIPEIVKHYKSINIISQVLNMSKYHR